MANVKTDTSHSVLCTERAFERAFEQYRELLKPRHQKSYIRRAPTMQDVLAEVGRIEAKQRSSSYTRNLTMRLTPMIRLFERYAPIVDVVVQVGVPCGSALIWGCFRILLTAASIHRRYFDKLLALFDKMSEMLPIYQSYEKVLAKDFPDVENALVQVYYSMLEFLHKARKVFSKRGFFLFARNFWRDFESDFGNTMGNFESSNSMLKEHVSLAKIVQIDIISTQQKQQTELIVEVLNNVTSKDSQPEMEKSAMLQWLCKADLESDFERESSRRMESSGTWLLEHVDFREWLASPASSRILRILGGPGSGKTVLSTSIIHSLQPSSCQDNDTGATAAADRSGRSCVSYFFCSKAEENQNVLSILAGLIKQMLCQLDSIPDFVVECYKKSLNSGRSSFGLADNPEVLLQSLCKLFKQVHIVVDGLDELEDQDDVAKTFTSLGKTNANMWIVLLSRDTPELNRMLKQYPAIRLSEEANQKEIQEDLYRYLEKELKQLHYYSDALEKTVHQKLRKGAEGMFLWASLMLRSLEQATSVQDAVHIVNDMPTGLDNYYSSILEKIRRRPRRVQVLARDALLYMSTAHRPLHKDELEAFLTFDKSGARNEKIEMFKDAILNACSPLVEYVAETNILRFVHTSVRDFLVNQGTYYPFIGSIKGNVLHFEENDGHSELADICLTYLLRIASAADGTSQTHDLPTTLSSYATSFWGFHVLKSKFDPNLADKMHKYLSSRERRLTWITQQLFCTSSGYPLQHLVKMQKELQMWASSTNSEQDLDTSDRLDWIRDICQIMIGIDASEEGHNNIIPADSEDKEIRTPMISYFDSLMVIRDLSREYTMRSWLDEGEKWMTDALKQKRAEYGDEHVSTCWLLNSLGLIYDQQGRVGLSVETHEKALKIQEKYLGRDRLETIWTVNELGRVYRHLKRYDEAIAMHQRALTVLTKLLPEDDLQLGWTMNTMARAYRENGDSKSGLEYLQKGVTIQRKHLGEDHPHVLWATADIGRCYRDQKVLKQSIKYHRACYEGRLKVLGPDHPDTWWAMNDLGLVLKEDGQLADANPLHIGALNGQRRHYGENHPHTKWSQAQVDEINALMRERLNGPSPINYSSILRSTTIKTTGQSSLDYGSLLKSPSRVNSY